MSNQRVVVLADEEWLRLRSWGANHIATISSSQMNHAIMRKLEFSEGITDDMVGRALQAYLEYRADDWKNDEVGAMRAGLEATLFPGDGK